MGTTIFGTTSVGLLLRTFCGSCPVLFNLVLAIALRIVGHSFCRNDSCRAKRDSAFDSFDCDNITSILLDMLGYLSQNSLGKEEAGIEKGGEPEVMGLLHFTETYQNAREGQN